MGKDIEATVLFVLLGFRLQGAELGIERGIETAMLFQVWSLGFRVWGLGCSVVNGEISCLRLLQRYLGVTMRVHSLIAYSAQGSHVFVSGHFAIALSSQSSVPVFKAGWFSTYIGGMDPKPYPSAPM